MREAILSAHSQEACNSLPTNKMQLSDRKSKTQNIIETASLQSTIEFFMQTIDFANSDPGLDSYRALGEGKLKRRN